MELNENQTIKVNNKEPSVFHIRFLQTMLNNIIIQKNSFEEMMVCENYKQIILAMREIAQNKYYFFKMNPLYDFFKFGFLEIFKPKRWNLRLRFDFSGYINEKDKLEQLLNYLVKNFQNIDI